MKRFSRRTRALSGQSRLAPCAFATTGLSCLFVLASCTHLQAADITPFGAGAKVAARVIKPINPTAGPALAVDIFAPANAGKFAIDPVPGTPLPEGAYALVQEDGKNALRLNSAKFVAALTTLRTILPEDQSGDAWAKNKDSYISLLCKSDKSTTLSLHLLKHGKTPGTFKAAFAVNGNQWQRVLLPLDEFNLKSFTGVMGLGFRNANSGSDATAYIADVEVGSMTYSDLSWASHRHSISLKGDWRFAPDPTDTGLKSSWNSDSFDDASWKTLQSGQSWEEQGVENHGWGWYRQRIMVPKEFAGVPLTLNLSSNPSDDDTYFNGARVGGWSGEYKYSNQIPRSYTVPAAAIKYGELNTIAIRFWGGDLTFIGTHSGLTKGVLSADLDPYQVMLRANATAPEMAVDNFDLSDAQHGMPFQMVFRFPGELAKGTAALQYDITDHIGLSLNSGRAPLTVGADGIARGVVDVNADLAKTIYQRGRLKANLLLFNGDQPVYSGTQELTRLSFAKRDNQGLPALPETLEDTPYGKLKLVDDIDPSQDTASDPHPYLQSGMGHDQDRVSPGSAVQVTVHDILGKPARESETGWFAYRVGRGKLKPHTTYLLRIYYPEDKPRFAPIEVQTGQNFMDVGWKNGVGANDAYDNWPLSKSWQWYDVMVPLDDTTTGSGGVGTASAENGVWVYFMNKVIENKYYSMWSGGPAVGRVKLYEIDPLKNAPVITKPQGLPQRVLSFDWERQPDHDPADLVRYAKLMGYSSISPVIVKWFFANYSDPLNGYTSVAVDDHDYWTTKDYDPASGQNAAPALPGKKSQHVRYLEATKELGLNYVPRFEWGGSQDLPKEAWAVDPNGQLTKPNRFAPWCGDLLNPLTWEDLRKLMDHLVKPYAKDNPQLTGALWRIRCDRMPISYSKADIQMFSQETGTPLPPGGDTQLGAWASGEMKAKYDDWWHLKRAQFHAKLAALLQSYRSDLELYYYNWDEDKFGMIQPDITSWAFVSNVVKSGPEGGRAAYEKERASRKALTGADYIEVMRTGNFGNVTAMHTNRADYGIRPGLYKDIKGIQLFAPANYLCYVDKPDYLNYFQTADGLAVSNVVSYDEIGARSINPKYEGNMVTPGGPAFSMALELLSYFNGDARTLNYTVYTYGRGFADAHRRFAQAFLALPAIEGKVVDQGDVDIKVRSYASANGAYVGVAYKGYAAKTLTVKLPGVKAGALLKNLVSGLNVPLVADANGAHFEIAAGPMELNAYLIQ